MAVTVIAQNRVQSPSFGQMARRKGQTDASTHRDFTFAIASSVMIRVQLAVWRLQA
jgi:hypothetical protein